MAGSRKKQKKSRKVPGSDRLLDQLRPGMPARDSVREVLDFVSPQGVHRKILRTSEMDAYDPIPKASKKRGSKS
jgi:hypothetical protein